MTVLVRRWKWCPGEQMKEATPHLLGYLEGPGAHRVPFTCSSSARWHQDSTVIASMFKCKYFSRGKTLSYCQSFTPKSNKESENFFIARRQKKTQEEGKDRSCHLGFFELSFTESTMNDMNSALGCIFKNSPHSLKPPYIIASSLIITWMETKKLIMTWKQLHVK